MESNNWKIDFLGIGAEKAISTWVADCLKEHPQICLSEPKEIHFFNEKTAYIWHRKNSQFDKGLGWYRKAFAHCKVGQLKGEFSTFYLWDEIVPGRVHKLFPNVKIIVTLRDPVQRAFSQYKMYRYYFKKENRHFELVIENEPEYIEKGMYMRQLNNWLKYYRSDQIHVIIADDAQENPAQVIKELYTFLGVDPNFTPGNWNTRLNTAKQTRFPFVSELMGFFTRFLVASNLSKTVGWLKSLGLKNWAEKLNTKKIEPSKIDEKSTKFLYGAFKSDIEELETFLNRKLTNWKYE